MSNMALYLWLMLGLAAVAQGSGNTLKWPVKYTVKATKITITSNLIEDSQVWKTKSKIRIDYNGGAMSDIILKNRSYRFGITYKMHPEAFLNQTSHMVCHFAKHGVVTDKLPETWDLKYVGKEEYKDIETVKYISNEIDEDADKRVKSTLWAAYNEAGKYWFPVKYEKMTYNTDTGFKENHVLWEYSGFSKNFSSKDVFEVNSACTEQPEEVTMDSDIVTKHLAFIDPEDKNHVDHVFKAFKTTYGRKYADEKEHALRRNIFQKKMRQIVAINNKNLGYKLAINQFADRTPQEMVKYMGLRRRPEGKTGNIPFPYTQRKLAELTSDLPREYDSRLFGLVSKVKNQAACGSCWTFGTTAAVEGALAKINGGRLVALANQALIDCAWAFDVSGCNGGTDNGAYEWMMQYGLPTEAEYGPYKNADDICKIKNMTKIYPIRGYTDVAPLNVEALKLALVNHGPLSVSVHVTSAFSSYSSGIFYDTECVETSLNHEVTLVGYGERYGETYWILKNSWGAEWGIDGYMYISAKDNVCGVATEPTYVVI